MPRLLSIGVLCIGMLLSVPVLADNFCLTQAGDPQLSFPGTSNPAVFAVKDDPTLGYALYLCSPTDLDLSWFTGYSFGDFNQDGWPDLLLGVKSNSGGKVKVFLNDKTGSGTVVLSATLHTGASAAPDEVDALDLNGDGVDDIITANGSDGTFSVMLNDGTGAFPSLQQYAAGSDVTLLAAVDMSGDGYPDVITVSTQDQTVSVSLNNGDGTFAMPAVYHVGGPVATITIADFNNDGYPDIYVSSVNDLNLFAPPPLPSTAGGSQQLLNNGDGTFTESAWIPYASTSSGGGGMSIGSGVDLSISATGLLLLTGGIGSQPPGGTVSPPTVGGSGGGITVTSGGKITPPTTPTTVTIRGGKSSSAGNASSGSGAASAGSGGGAMEWLSLALLSVAGFLRRKRA